MSCLLTPTENCTYYRSSNPPALAAYMLLNRITLAQMAGAISQTGSAVSASDLSTWFSQRGVPAADYTYQEPVSCPPVRDLSPR